MKLGSDGLSFSKKKSQPKKTDYEDEEEPREEHGCGGYGYDYAPGSEICEFCEDRESCAEGGYDD